MTYEFTISVPVYNEAGNLDRLEKEENYKKRSFEILNSINDQKLHLKHPLELKYSVHFPGFLQIHHPIVF